MEKILLMLAAAQLTQASEGDIAHTELAQHLAANGTISPDLLTRNLETWEEFRIFYAALQQAVADDKDWPPPPAGQTLVGSLVNPATLQGLVPLLASAVPQLAPVLAAIQGLLSTVSKPVAPVGPVVTPPPLSPNPPVTGK